MAENNKKHSHLGTIKFIAILTVLVILFLFLGYTASKGFVNKINFERDVLNIAEKNEEQVFTIDNITFFSSCNADAEVNSNTSLQINNLYQYTDIAIFINPVDDELNYKNTIKELYIDNINYSQSPTVGTPQLYYKNINEFATPKFLEENKVNDSLHFNITSEDSADLSTATLYNNCANPITLTYVNNNIKTDYSIEGTESTLTYDGSLLKKCGVTLSSIETSISFNINIVNNLDQKFICPVYFKIPLESEDGTSIYDGKVLLKDDVNYNFFRYV